MKRLLFLLVIISLIGLSPWISHLANAEQQTTTPDTSQQKEQYEKSMDERLKKLNKEFEELKAKAGTKTEQAQKSMRQYLGAAEKKQKVATKKLEKMRKESVKRWKKFSAELDAAADDFEQAYEKAKSHFRE